MMRYNRLAHSLVDDIPEQLAPGMLYVSSRYATAVHLCCCGCGSEIVTPLAPAQWRMTFDGENVSLHPSIGNWNLPCRSHYIIMRGQVIEADTWSEQQVAHGHARDKQARTAYYDSKMSPAPLEAVNEQIAAPNDQQGWWARLWCYLMSKR